MFLAFALGGIAGAAWHYFRLPPFGLGFSAYIGAMLNGEHIPLGLETTEQLQENERTTPGFAIAYPSVHDFLSSKLAQRKSLEPAIQSGRVSIPKAPEEEKLAALRQELLDTLGVPRECIESNAQLIQREPLAEHRDFLIERLIFKACDSELRLYGLLGTSKTGETAPLVIALHGTGASPERIFGLDSPLQYDMPDYHNELGLRLLREGFAVLAPQLITEIKLQEVEHYSESRSSLDLRAMPLGYRIQGIEIGMISSAIGYFAKDGNADKSRIAAYGISLGGQTAFYLTALDERIQAVVVSQFIDDRASKLVGLLHPLANWRFVSELSNIFPGILRNFDDVNVAGLVAPRPLFIEVGGDDGRSEGATRLLPKLQDVYAARKAPKFSICLENKQGVGHEIIANGSLEFLRYWLFDRSGPQLRKFCH